ncbi:MAG: hypothetical protein AB8I08_11115 [Sandaracinaceae bacterium]
MSTHRHLDVITVEDPCTVSWEGMGGDGPVRFCGLCKKNVYNLSAMTADEAEQTVREKEGRLCVRFYRRKDGTVSTIDCAPIRFAALRRTARRTMTGAAALLVALLGLVTSLGVLRFIGVSVDDTPVIGSVAKALQKVAEPAPILMGAPPPPPEDMQWEMGDPVATEGLPH